MEGPYKNVDEMDKVAAMLGWLGDKGFQLYDSIDWEAIEKDKSKYKDVLQSFELHFRPCQTELHSWYQLGSVYSKDQHEVSQGAQGHYHSPVGVPYESDYELHEDSVQVIYTNQDTTNIKFDEISNSQALGGPYITK